MIGLGGSELNIHSRNDRIKQIRIEYLIVQIIAVVMYPCSVHPDHNLESVFLLE